MSALGEFDRFPSHWDMLPFSDAVNDVTSGNRKIQKGDYLETGSLPIVDQGQNLYGGYTNEQDSACRSDIPSIVFGDHTRAFKYIEEPFALGADGAKVLEPKINLDKKFLFYYFKQLNIESAGYSRHFKFLKEIFVPVPPLPEQKRIATILDKADALRRKRQQAIDLADQFLRSVFLDMFGDLSPKKGKSVKLGDVTLVDAKMVDPREEEYLDLIHIGPNRIEKGTGVIFPALTAREEKLISKKFLFDEKYVLYSKIRPYLKKCALAEYIGLCSADMYPIRPKPDVLTKEFLWRLFLSDFFTRYTESLPGRANIPKLNRNELSKFEFTLPDLLLQQRFSDVVGKLKKINEKNNYGMAGFENVFQSINQKAFLDDL